MSRKSIAGKSGKSVYQPDGSLTEESRELIKGVAESATPPSKPPKPPKTASSSDGPIFIPAPTFRVMKIDIVGDTSLICNAVPKKVIEIFRDKRIEGEQAPQPRKSKPPRDFNQEYLDSLYPLSDGTGYGFPCSAFKHALVGACRQIAGLDMTNAKRNLFVHADDVSRSFDVVRLRGRPTMQEALVRLMDAKRSPDLHYRGEFLEWGATLTIEFNYSLIGQPQLINLLAWAGKTEGVGENRPSSPVKSGNHGQFHPATEDD